MAAYGSENRLIPFAPLLHVERPWIDQLTVGPHEPARGLLIYPDVGEILAEEVAGCDVPALEL